MRKTIAIASLASLTTTAALAAINVGNYTGFGDFELTAKNSAGTNPTLDVKLQHSDPASRGYAYAVAGTTETKLKTGASTLVKLAATFTQGASAASIVQVGFKLKKIGTLAAGKKVTVEICANNAGAPGTALGSTTIDIDTEIGTSFATVIATFAVAVDVSAATIYHIVLSADYTASGTNCVVARSNTVASGGNQQTYDATNWTAVATESFETFVEQYSFTDVTGGAFTQVTTAAARQIKTLNVDSLKSIVRPHVTIGGTNSPAFYVGVDVVTDSRYS